MGSPDFVADFDSATGFVRTLSAALHDRPFRNLGRSAFLGRLVRASSLLPGAWATAAFARAGGNEAIPPDRLTHVSADAFSAWVADTYPRRPVAAIAIGASNGALVHLCAALGIPWLPQTFLVPVARRADPHDPAPQLAFADKQATELLANQPGLQIHHMHDPNQDALMLSRLAYFRMKQRTLTPAYRQFITDVLAPGGNLLIVDCAQRWPVTRIAERHVFQPGAVGGLTPDEYLHGSSRVAEFLKQQGSTRTHWQFPTTNDTAPEAEWGYDDALTAHICHLAEQRGYHVRRLRFPAPESLSPLVADLYLRWYGCTSLLAETFISVEPHWALHTRAAPLWLTFPVERSAALFADYLAEHPQFEEVIVTLFANGVRSAGQPPARQWQAIANRSARGWLAGVNPGRWPADFAALTRYAEALRRHRRPTGPRPAPMPLDDALDGIAELGKHDDVELLDVL